MSKIRAIIVLFISGVCVAGICQDVLTLSDATQIALNNNFSLKLAENNIKIAENNASKENNGYNPILDFQAGPGATFGGSRQNFNNDLTAETKNAFSWNVGATISAGYTIFDQERDNNYEQLKEILDLSNLQLRQAIEVTLFEIHNQYYLIAQLVQNIKVLEESLEVSERRLERSKVVFDLGQGPKINVLNAEVDLKRDSVNILNAYQQSESAKRNLNFLIGRDVNNLFKIDQSLELSNFPSKDYFIEKALKENVQIAISNQNQKVNEIQLKLIDSGGNPKIGTNANFNYNFQDNAPGSFISSSRSQGFNLGVTLNWNLYDGGRRKIQEENTLINIENENILKEEVKLQLVRDISNTWEEYQNALFIIDVEESGVNSAKANLERTRELFNRGQVTSVEFRQAQLNEINAQIGLNNARYTAKLLEVELVYLSGGILDY